MKRPGFQQTPVRLLEAEHESDEVQYAVAGKEVSAQFGVGEENH